MSRIVNAHEIPVGVLNIRSKACWTHEGDLRARPLSATQWIIEPVPNFTGHAVMLDGLNLLDNTPTVTGFRAAALAAQRRRFVDDVTALDLLTIAGACS